MPSVIVERQGAVFEITLNRPEVLNAVNRETIAALAAAAAEAAEDRVARAVLLRGAGTHFCAGGDIGMFGELIRLSPGDRRKMLYQTVDALHPLWSGCGICQSQSSSRCRGLPPGSGSAWSSPPISPSPPRMRFSPAAISISAPAPMAA